MLLDHNTVLSEEAQESGETMTWRDLLAEIIDDRNEKRRLGYELGVRADLLHRWASNKATPYPEQLRQLVRLVSQAYRADMQRLVEKEEGPVSPMGQPGSDRCVSARFYQEAVRGYVTQPRPWRQAQLQQIVLQQMIDHLIGIDTPKQQGLVALLVACVAPLPEAPVRSLRVVSSAGTGLLAYRQWDGFLGAESHAGLVVSRGSMAVRSRTTTSFDTWWAALDGADIIHSTVSAPLRRGEGLAGCITVCSLHAEAFPPELLPLIQEYADLLASLGFEPSEFYLPGQIQLGLVPPHAHQREYLATFHQRVMSAISTASRQGHALSRQQAELQAWQSLEEDLLQRSATYQPCLQAPGRGEEGL